MHPITPDVVQRVEEMVPCSPKSSTRRLSRELVILHSIVWKIIDYHLSKHAYHIQTVHKLQVEDYAAQQAMVTFFGRYEE